METIQLQFTKTDPALINQIANMLNKGESLKIVINKTDNNNVDISIVKGTL